MIHRVVLGLMLAIAASSVHAETLPPPSGSIVQFDRRMANSTSLHLAGYLARPRVEGRLPAVVVLHGCGGLSGWFIESATELAAWGYVALVPDSLTPRGIETACTSDPPDQARDAYAALRFLKRQQFVDPGRIAVLGFSMGGISALSDVELGVIEGEFVDKFRAAIAYYPYCVGGGGVVTVPTLILIGEKDDWTPAEVCRDFMKVRNGRGAELELIVYPDAFHGFDAPTLQPGVNYLGHHLEYNEAAARAAKDATRRFLERVLRGD